MGIETQIKQSSFRNDYHKVLVNVIYTSNWVIENMKQLLQVEDITHQQYNILRILRGGAPAPLSTLQIRERMLDKMSDTSRIVDRLVAKELVKKCTCPKDKRLVDVTISDKGQKLLKKLDAESDHIDEVMNNLSEDEAELLSSLLDKLRKKD